MNLDFRLMSLVNKFNTLNRTDFFYSSLLSRYKFPFLSFVPTVKSLLHFKYPKFTVFDWLV